MVTTCKMYGSWRSLASYNVRIGLALKGLSCEEEYLGLLEGDQFQDWFKKLNPESNIPVLVIDSTALNQSLAILEYLEETQPDPPLLPENPLDRANVRSFALMSVADAHPLYVPRVRKYLANHFGAKADQIETWAQNWIFLALQAMETRLKKRSGSYQFCFGDTPGLADILLVSQAAAAELFNVSVDEFSTVRDIQRRCLEIAAFRETSPQALKARLDD